MKPIQHRRSDFGSNFALRTICVVVAAAFAEAAFSQSLPTGFNPAAGSSTATTNIAGDTMTVNKTTSRAIIDWTTFNVGSGYTINFTGSGPGVGGAVLNRVSLGMAPGGSTPNISTIAGTVNGTGMLVMLSNPNGILFTPTAVVNVGALVATTGRVEPTAFMSDGTVAISYPAEYPRAGIVNQGHITAEAAGLVALVAPSVTNAGVIAATGGKILLAGTDVATISTNGGLYEFAVTGAGTNVTNAATGVLNGATIYMSTGDLAHVVSQSINLDGIQQASGAIVVNTHTVELTSPLQAPSVSGNSDVVNVRKTGMGGRIQDGVNIARSGGLVNVAAGTFAESVTVGKALTIDGAGMGQTIIEPGSDADGIVVQGNIGGGATVAITDLTVQGGHNGIRVADNTTLGTITLDHVVVRDNTTNGFISNDGGSNPTTVSSINIRNSVFAGNGFGNGSADINLFRFNGAAQLSNVDILGTRSTDVSSATDFGLQIRGQGELNTMTAAGHVTLDNVRIAGTYKKAHLAIQRYSDEANIAMSNVVLGGARSASAGTGTISVPSSAAGWATFFSSDMRGALAFGNTLFAGGTFGFGDIRIGGDTGGLRIDASQAEFSGITRTHTAAGAENFAIEDRVVHALDDSGVGGLVTWQANNLYVTQASGSIQRGISAACTCDTVHVGAGTFTEQLTITKSLSLVGAGAGNTIVKAPASLVADNLGMRSILTIGGSATDATVSGFTFRGPSAGINAGIFVRDGAHAYIHDNKVLDIRDAALLSGAQNGAGIFVGRAVLGTSGTAVIENNEITGYQKGGIVVDGPGSQASITGNTVVGEGPTNVIAQNGIQVSRGASATVSGNTVRGNVYTGSHANPDDFASGIMFFIADAYLGQGGVTIGANTVTANEYGIWTNDSRTLATTSLTGVSGNSRNAVAFFNGGYQSEGPSLKYPAWSAANTAFVSSVFSGAQSGDIRDVGGALGVSGWSGYTAIQPAINAVATGGTVNVAAGTYTQPTTLNVNKSVTLAGAGEANTFIDASGVSNNYGMLVTADHVWLKDFTFYGPTANVANAYGIKVQPAGLTADSRLYDFKITNVTSRGAGRAELDLNGVVGATIDYVTADGRPAGATSGTTAGAGIQITDSSGVTISNSITRNNAWGGVALFQSNRFFNQQTTDITVATSNTFNESNPLYLQNDSLTTPSFGVLNLPGFKYAVRNTATVGTGSDQVKYSQFTWMQATPQGAFNLAVNLLAPDASYIQGWSGTALTQTFHVGVGNLASGATRNMSIMTAVDRGDAGALINIYPGAYTETAANRVIHMTNENGVSSDGVYTLGLFVDKNNMTLRGVNASGNAITSADDVQAWITAGAITNFGMAHGVMADNVTFEGLGFKPKPDDLNKTIEIAGDNFTFRNSVVDNRLGGGTTKAGGGGALYFGELDPVGHPMTRLTVTGSNFYDGSVTITNGVGVALDGVTYAPASQRVISGNRFIGSSNYRFAGVSLSGKDEIGWRPMRIGAVTVTGNSFSGFDDSVLVRGEQQGVDLRQVMRDNSFDRSVLVTDAAGNARGETYDSGPLDPHVPLRLKHSIQSSIGAGLNRSVTGDTVAVGPGTYAESIVLNGRRNLTFNGSTIQGLTINPGAAGSGIGGSATANTSLGFRFDAPVVLLSDTSLATTGANIVFNGDIQTAGGSPFALSLMAGAGDVVLASGGAPGAPLGFFSSTSNDFSLSGTLWVSGFDIGATGSIALSDHSLHGTQPGGFDTLRAGANVDGTVVSASRLGVEAGGNVDMSIDAAPRSYVHAGGTVNVRNPRGNPIEINGRLQVPETLVSSTEGSRVIPPEMPVVRNTSPVRNVVAPDATPLTVASAPPAAVGAVLDQGKPVELDLTPGNGRDR